ncbi:type VI secretion system baseplate subunit TssF [Plastoroseomonas hellenica]|uniref:Type VI secretion system baseplate subunit TssF n=1 Tax=Plastoroseomonas hellenica TaxID=2687306 RepID=A0ABS5F5S2_9PROT|nr:type VI secretion system baseplate subunit TssF [Plastoroseomonas hellenica]MBR0667892.1 type VI secretion system baseplate subunit TssF [Plastoroseomonas hellenica]
MSDTLLPYYNRELAAIRKLAGEFADAYPKVASRLRVTQEAVDDPYVERLLEGVAFLGARVLKRLDDELPELSDSLLEMLSPQLLAPVPSMTTLRLHGPAEAPEPVQVKRGLLLETEPVRGEPVRFATCHDVTLWPIEIEAARLSGLPISAPANPRVTGAQACLRLTLKTKTKDITFAQLGIERLRFHLRGVGAQAALLMELLATSTIGVALADSALDPNPTLLGPEVVAPAGFADEEAALPWPKRAFAGHRLLTEYFSFPEKFLYLDITGLESRALLQESDKLEIFFYLARPAPELERVVTAESFALGCTPAINLFPHRCEPVALDGTLAEFRAVPDARRPAALEIYAVEAVRESRSDGTIREVLPFYRLGSDTEDATVAEITFIAAREPSNPPMTGTETMISLRDLAYDPTMPADGVLTVEALCCNRDLPSMLPFGGGQPQLRLVDGGSPVKAIDCLSPPTSTLRPNLLERSAWKLISHLALNHLSIAGGPAGAHALREVLRLHDLRDTAESRAALGALLTVDAKPGVARLPGGRAGAFVRGLEVTLGFDAQVWNSAGLYPLAQVLERFLAVQVSINAFSRVAVTLRGRSGLAARFPARSGTRVLL